MGTTTGGLPYPDGSDAFDPSGDMQAGFDAADVGRIIPVANETARDALASAWSPTTSKPLFVFREDLSVVQRTVDGSTWQTDGVWQDYTPTRTGFPATVTVARWMRIGNTISLYATLSLTGAASGELLVGLPVTARTTGMDLFLAPLGVATAIIGGTRQTGPAVLASSTTLGVLEDGGGSNATARWNATVPNTWGSGSVLYVRASYEAA